MSRRTMCRIKSLTAGRRFRITEHYTDLHADLVDKDNDGLRLRSDSRKFSKCLAHKTSLLTHLCLAHVALDLIFRRERRHGVHDYDVDGTGANE